MKWFNMYVTYRRMYENVFEKDTYWNVKWFRLFSLWLTPNTLNMKKTWWMNAYYLIITHTTIVNEMVFPEANSQNLYYLFSKLLRYEHQTKNYRLAWDKEMIQFGLTIKKLPAIKTISEHFNNQWIQFYMIVKRLSYTFC